MASQSEKAETFRRLHHQKGPLILPNAWDVPSARVFEDAGFPAVATSSAALMVSLGYPDGETIPKRKMIAVIARIAKTLTIPLSVDVVAGFGRGPREVAATIKMVLEAGAIGINVEDAVPSTQTLFPLPAQVRKLRAIRELGESMGVPLVINARTDALRYAPGEPKDRMREAIRRARAYRDGGSDCVYPMGLVDAGAIATFVDAVGCPVNVMTRRGLPPIPELERLGVKRVSFGPYPSYASMGLLKRISEEVIARGTYESMLEGAITHDELNQLAVPRGSTTTHPN